MLEELELLGGAFAIEEDEAGGALRENAHFLELVEGAEFVETAGFDDDLCAFLADAGDAHELLAVGGVDLDRLVGQEGVGPGEFGVDVEGQVAVLVEGHFFEGEAVIAKEVGGLVEAVFAPGVFWRIVFKRGVFDGVEFGVVNPAEAELSEELFTGGDEFEVGFADSTDDKLGGAGWPAAVPGIVGGHFFANLGGPFEGLEQLGGELLFGGELVEATVVGGFEVDGYTTTEVHGADELVFFCAGHDLQVEIAAVLVFAAEDLGGVDELVLHADAATDDTGTEKDAFYSFGPVDLHEGFGEIVGGEGGAAHVAASAEGAVIAVSLAS